jgi:hypothetical protein
MYLPYMAYIFDELDESVKKTDERIEELKREFFYETPKLPRKLKKKRRKELNGEYSFLVSIRNHTLNLY